MNEEQYNKEHASILARIRTCKQLGKSIMDNKQQSIKEVVRLQNDISKSPSLSESRKLAEKLLSKHHTIDRYNDEIKHYEITIEAAREALEQLKSRYNQESEQ